MSATPSFNYYQPTEIRFGCGRARELGRVAGRYGKRALLVTVPVFDAIAPAVEAAKASLTKAGLAVAHFDGVVANPTTESITAGAAAAVAHQADVIVGFGGGSSMDSAKAIAVEATHEGSCWDYLFFRETAPTEATLPVIAVTTTAGTGSEVTQVAVVTHTGERCKSALYNPIIFPKVAIVDPDLTHTVPAHVTASTGFDAFTHAFEAYISSGATPYTDTLAVEALRLIIENLPAALADGTDADARAALSWANTLAGLCIANAGVTLPHGMGMAISGMYPRIMHGEALALVYPECMRYTWSSAPVKFATLGRILDASLASASDDEAAERSCELLDAFLTDVGMWFGLADFDVPRDELAQLAEACLVLPDYQANPKVATPDDVTSILESSFQR